MLAALLLAMPTIWRRARVAALAQRSRCVHGTDQAAVTSILAAKGIPVEVAYPEGDRLVLRFQGVNQQLAPAMSYTRPPRGSTWSPWHKRHARRAGFVPWA